MSGCENCTTHECGVLYAECPCCAARAAAPGDVTLGGAAVAILDDQPAAREDGGAKTTEPHVYVSTSRDHHFCDRCLMAEDDDRADHTPDSDSDPLGLADYIPYEGKSIREIIDEYVLVRGDLVDRDYPHAREQLTSVIEDRIRRAVDARVEAVISALDDASVFGYLDDTGAPVEAPKTGYFIEVDDMTRIARETTS